MPGQGMIPEVTMWRPQQDSNLRSRLRRAHATKPLTCTNPTLNLSPWGQVGDGPARDSSPSRFWSRKAWLAKSDPRQSSDDDDIGEPRR